MATTLRPHRRRRTRRHGRLAPDLRDPGGRARLHGRRDRGRLPRELTGTLYRNGPGRTRSAASPTRTCSTATGSCRSSASTARPPALPQPLRAHDPLPRRACGRQAGDAQLRPAAPGRAARQRFPDAGERRRTPASSTTPATCSPSTRAAGRGSSTPTRWRPIGEYDFDGELKGGYTYSAHPTWDPATGELFNFGIQYGRRTKLRTYRVDARGRLHHLQRDHAALRDDEPRLRAHASATWSS